MININAIPMNFEPRQKIVSLLPKYADPHGHNRVVEMSQFESAFLCGVLKTFRPKKILEIGVAAGGTTAIILQALEDIGEIYEMHSVDLAAEFYRDKSKLSGFIAAYAKENVFGNLRGKHKFHLGKILPQVIDEIGGGVDFVILDTLHYLPGEVLDFLTVLPYLTDNAVVVLHDVLLYQTENPIDDVFTPTRLSKFFKKQ